MAHEAQFSVLNPSVQVPFESKEGNFTREEQIARLKRYFSLLDLAELLKERGMDSDELIFGEENGELPLYLFDDILFETRHPSGWVEKSIIIPAKAGFTQPNGSTKWKPATVLDYLEPSNTYLVKWDDSGETAWLPRIQVCFSAEDPLLFADRVVHASQARAAAKVKMRFGMYVKNMPIDDILPLDEDVIKKIKKNVYNTKALRERNEDVSQLLSEVTQNYVCIMNELVFIESLHRQETPAQEYLIEFAEPLPLDIPKPRVPRNGTISIPGYEIEEKENEFYVTSCLTRPEVILATVKVRDECSKILNLTILQTQYSKSLRIEEFEQMQASTIDAGATYLKESWISTLKNVFRVTFKKIDKGWFNMKETSMDAYNASKMKRYLTMVQLMMEDSLRYLVEDALQKYTCFVEQHIGSAHIDIKSINEVICEWPKLTYSHMIQKPPLFSLEIVMLENTLFDYNTHIPSIEQVITNCIEHCINSLKSIPQVHFFVMSKLKWTQTLHIATIKLKESLVQALITRVQCSK
ncbi:uncharacterized protein [Physcomitrium patens]|uniref:uncharacterized protein isoform X3 n=1 Tax=Physcomitrium patens TaxID=3218 RepID=UPI003CCCC10C